MNENLPPYIYGETLSSEAPRPTSVVREVLSKYLDPDVQDKTGLRETLNDVYKAFASHDETLIWALDKLEQKNKITNEDVLVLSVLFAASEKLELNLGFLYQAVLAGTFNREEASNKISELNLDQPVARYIETIVSQLS